MSRRLSVRSAAVPLFAVSVLAAGVAMSEGEDPPEDEIAEKVVSISRDLRILNAMWLMNLTQGGGLVLPDDFEFRDPAFQRRVLRINGELRISWESGLGVRDMFYPSEFDEGHLPGLSDEDYLDFVRDDFATSQSILYTLSECNFGGTGLFMSVGPDGVRNLDFYQFDLCDENYGFGPKGIDLIYDPTNGLQSTGDILSLPLGKYWGRGVAVLRD